MTIIYSTDFQLRTPGTRIKKFCPFDLMIGRMVKASQYSLPESLGPDMSKERKSLALPEAVRVGARREGSESAEFEDHLRAILDILRAKAGQDFRCYKPNTLVRRIRRRMTLGKIDHFAGYVSFLHGHPEEVDLLQKDLLIGVTDFFRQPQAWEILQEKIIAPLVENAQAGSELRIWVPGCSTGKEAYSLAMLLSEEVEKCDKKLSIQIFATDSDLAALATGRSGIYSKEEIGENVSSGRLKRFFAPKGGSYQVGKPIREQVVFAPQNLTADPPFSRLDLISCRNVLIYLEQQVQRKIIALFHFALREGGFLFLGSAETVGDHEDLFEAVSKKWRIYRRTGVGRPVGVEIPVRPTGAPLPAVAKGAVPPSMPRTTLASMAQQILLERFVPASVMIDRRLQVVYVHGAVEEYLTFPAGELTTRVADMTREGLRACLRGAIGKCLEMSRPVSVTARVRRDGKSVPVKATVAPLRYPREADGLLLITFEDSCQSAAKSGRGAAGQVEVHQLEEELKLTREELQSTIEQLEASNDQLKASNEEVTAANEELQSASEEMEASKEELQSLNEELNTINVRLHEKMEELESTSNDILNLLSSTNIAMVFLDKELKVRRHTPASTNLFSLIPSDAGRPIEEILRRFRDEALLDEARRVLTSLSPLAQEVQGEDGRWYIRRILPYRTQDDRIEGVVITFVDVCDLKETEEALRRQQAELETARAEAENARGRLAVIMDSIADGFFAFDRQWRITHVNDAALRHYGRKREEMVGRTLFEVFPGARGTAYEVQYRSSMESGQPVHFEAPSTISDRTMELHAYPGPDNMTILFRDVSERNRIITALREAHDRAARLAKFPEENPNPVARVSSEGKVLYRNPAVARLPGWSCEVGQPIPAPLLPLVGKAIREGKEAERDVELGGRFYSVSVAPFPAEGYANLYGRDTTERKQAEEALRRYQLLSEHTRDILLFMRRENGQILEANTAATKAYGYSRDELLNLTIHDLRAPHTEELIADQMEDADTRGILFETVHRRKDGSAFPVEVSSRGATIGGTRTLISVVRDITERHLRDSRIGRLTKLYAVLSQVSEAIVRTHDEERLFGEVCRIVAEEGGFPLVWVGRVEEPQIVPAASCGPATDYLKEIRVETKGQLGIGPTGTSVREDHPVINDDFDTNPSASPWRKSALRFGFRASAAFPLRREGRVMGALTLYAGEPGAFDQEQVSLLEALCADISYALDAMQQEQRRSEAEEALRRRTLELQQLTESLEQRVEQRTADLAKSNEMLQTEIAQRLRLVAAVEQAGEGVVILDPEGFIDYVNPAFENMSGYARADLLGKSYYDLLGGDGNDQELKKKLQDIVQAKGAWNGHVNRRKKDGPSYELDITFSPIREESGEVMNYLAVERDVTGEVRLQQHLRQMQKMEAMGTLAGGIAHDLNNLLNPIFINTELVLLDAPLEDRMRQYLQMVLQAAERGRNLVKQIITFSRQKEKERKPTKLEPLIKEALNFLRSTIPQTVEIRENIQKETASILADPTQIHQVVMNLFSNASYAMRERGGVLEVNLTEVEIDEDMALHYPDFTPGPYLRLTVTDTGQGMTREVMERAFDPFFTTKKPGEGSGMGLSVVHGIVRSHRGAITAYSEVGKGTTFNIFFPRLGAESFPSEVSRVPLASGRERILLVDDEEAQVESVRNMLERLGYRVVAKTDSVEALALFQENPHWFDLVVTDQTMPHMTGVKLAEEILRIRPDLPVILCTGFSETVDANGAQASGICQFLMKPFSVREMADIIRRALERK
jgi:PAS domain S-box-containing protein